MKPHLGFAAVCFLAVGLRSTDTQASPIYFGNFAPGTEIDSSSFYGFASIQGQAGNYYMAAAVSFMTGADEIQLSSVDLALRTFSGSAMFLAVSTSDLPAINAPLLTLSTSDTIPLSPADPARISFVPDSAVTLAANTTYYLQLLATSPAGTSISWYEAINDTPILSNYSTYNFNYGTGNTYAGQDLGAYYITAATVPEASVSALALAGIAALAGVAHRARRRRQAE